MPRPFVPSKYFGPGGEWDHQNISDHYLEKNERFF